MVVLLLTSDVELSVFVVLSIISVLLDVELLIFLLSSTLVGSLIESLPLKKSSHKSLIKSNILSINELLSPVYFLLSDPLKFLEL